MPCASTGKASYAYSSILAGNTADPNSLPDMVDTLIAKMRVPNAPKDKVLVCLDAGIATEENQQKAKDSLTKKNGTKSYEKVIERVGRAVDRSLSPSGVSRKEREPHCKSRFPTFAEGLSSVDYPVCGVEVSD